MVAKYDDRTAKGWPLPHKGNRLYDDVVRLRETFTLIDQAITTIQDDFDGKQHGIETRLDSILEGATEDSEILDARVDAENEIHPNLGHHLRMLHSRILYIGEEFKGLLRQYNDLAYAQMHGEINAMEANQRRLLDIQQEEKERNHYDAVLQEQINALSFAHMDWVLSGIEAREGILEKISTINQTLIDVNQSIASLYDAMADTGVMTYKGARIAPSYEIADMLNDILAGTDDGEISVSVIPDEVKDEIANSQEIHEIIKEVFPNRS